MKRFLAILLVLIASAISANPNYQADNYCFYTKIGTGLSSSDYANIVAPYPPWSQSVQGYNAKLGHAPIVSLSLGCEVRQLLDLEVSFANRSVFKYRKLQTPLTGGASYTREFDLSVNSILFSVNLLGHHLSSLNWQIRSGQIYPMVGVGLGASDLLITNYRTVNLPPTGDSSPYASFSAESQYFLQRNFTYTLLAGLEYNQQDAWAISTGYRWFNAGKFSGPRYQRVATGSAVDLADDQWSMRFRANEWFIEFKIFI